ncbi:MAG: VanW family protein, partial [Chloroflexota bacterium]|nr:VanW family protein [Chloroflexota bacterium]
VDGRIRVVSAAKTGRTLDIEVGTQAIVAAFGAPDPTAKLRAQTLEPRYTADDLGTIALGDDLLAEASTSYAYSSEPRRRNVERAAQLENGWLVPPGGVFSYVENVGPVDAANGFDTGFGIVADEEGGVTTAPVIGGGICQVSTTLFQAAFWAGLPIEERYQHPYYLRSYGEAPRGLPGLDAMVNVEKDWSLDLKFRNPTDEWLAVLVYADGQNLVARLVGTDPGWDVRVSEPKVTNFVPKQTEMTFADSPELPRGQELLVESAEDGFDVTIERVVVKDGKVVDEYAVTSSFSPARNLTLRGTGG